jgi:hypothetical protein
VFFLKKMSDFDHDRPMNPRIRMFGMPIDGLLLLICKSGEN